MTEAYKNAYIAWALASHGCHERALPQKEVWEPAIPMAAANAKTVGMEALTLKAIPLPVQRKPIDDLRFTLSGSVFLRQRSRPL
jgi:hypothetical protein